jgi:uncharacterized membrane protein
MNKQEFIDALKSRLARFPETEVDDHISFYIEIIEDKIEDGLSESDAITELGAVSEIADQIVADIPLSSIAREKIKPKRRLRAFEIALLAVGSPIWLSLLVSAFAVVFSLYAAAWAVIASLWAGFGGIAGGAVGGVVGIGFVFFGNAGTALSLFSAGLVLSGLCIFMFWGCVYATRGMVRLTKKSVLLIKKCFVGKERNNE